MPLLYHAYVYLEFLILACTIYILAPASSTSILRSGIFDPISHLETVLAETPNFSASYSCVRLFSLRHYFKKAPIFFVSMFLPLFHLQLTKYFRKSHDINQESPDFRPDIACLVQINPFQTENLRNL